jgi:hypothetical protein
LVRFQPEACPGHLRGFGTCPNPSCLFRLRSGNWLRSVNLRGRSGTGRCRLTLAGCPFADRIGFRSCAVRLPFSDHGGCSVPYADPALLFSCAPVLHAFGGRWRRRLARMRVRHGGGVRLASRLARVRVIRFGLGAVNGFARQICWSTDSSISRSAVSVMLSLPIVAR